jgi:CheY-like chemotaxis protein
MLSVAPPSIMPASGAAPDSYVLLVDDHEPTLRQLDELLSGAGHRCVAARSGAEALVCCDRRRPRLVLTDLAMPNLDGFGLARWLKARYPSVPLVLMTGQPFDPETLHELRRTFADVLPKPVDIDHLLGLVDRVMPRNPGPDRRAASQGDA